MTSTHISSNAPEVIDIDYHALQALIARVEHALENELALTPDDLRLLLGAINTLLQLQTKLDEKNVTLNKLRKLLGMVQSSEQRRGSPSDQPEEKADQKRHGKPSNRKKKKPRKKVKPRRTEHHKLAGLAKGDPCPECPKGTLKKYDPQMLLRISGASPFTAVEHVIERLKCDLCGAIVRADLPDEVTQDGRADQRYGYSARAIMAIYKHFSGTPYYHQETLNDLFGCPITASTIFDQCEWIANDCRPVFNELKRLAANARLFYIDDTTHRILSEKGERRPNRNGVGSRLRTGIYTSGLIAVTASGQRLFLYNTNLGHAGEFLDTILSQRNPALPAPIIMSDALSSNKTTVEIPVSIALCNTHARRQFIDVENHYPKEVAELIALYSGIWGNERQVVEQKLDSEQRLTWHKTHSLPRMENIKMWCLGHLQAEDSEHHSGLIKACRYFIRHYDGLALFTEVAGAPIDNNIVEEGLKIPIRGRKASHFYRTQVGADVANVLTSVITTAKRNDVNAFEYLIRIQRNASDVKCNAKRWMPWLAEDDTS